MHYHDESFLRYSETAVGWYAIKTITDDRFLPKTFNASDAIKAIIANERSLRTRGRGSSEITTKRYLGIRRCTVF
jgi:hypothetical protein